jgi:hypothetical protein
MWVESVTAQRKKMSPIHPCELHRDELNEIGVSLNELGARAAARRRVKVYAVDAN